MGGLREYLFKSLEDYLHSFSQLNVVIFLSWCAKGDTFQLVVDDASDELDRTEESL